MSPLAHTSSLFAAGSSFKVDGVHSDTWRMYLRNWSMAMLPSTRSSLTDIPGRTGKRDAGSELSSRLLSYDLSIYQADAPQRHTLMRAFAAALDPRRGAHAIELVDEWPGWYISAIPVSDMTAAPEAGIKTDFTMAVEAADPHFYSTASQTVTWVPTASGQATTLTNPGNTDTPLIITVSKRPAAGGTLQNFDIVVGGVHVHYAGVVVGGDTLVIDTGAFTVKKNNVNDIANWSVDFPPLPGGPALGVVSAVSMTDQNNQGATVRFDYRARLL